jgi:hypothetical protein
MESANESAGITESFLTEVFQMNEDRQTAQMMHKLYTIYGENAATTWEENFRKNGYAAQFLKMGTITRISRHFEICCAI